MPSSWPLSPKIYNNIEGQSGTLTTEGMLYVNRCTWAHIVLEATKLLKVSVTKLLTKKEFAAISGKANPEGVII